MASIVESGWLYLLTHFNDFQLACLGSFFLHESVFFLSGLPFIYLERAGWLSKYKIQTKNNTPAAQERCITRLLLYHFAVNLPVMIASYPVFKYMGMRSSLPLPSWRIVLTQIIFYFILEDFVFYWGHRVLHTKLLVLIKMYDLAIKTQAFTERMRWLKGFPVLIGQWLVFVPSLCDVCSVITGVLRLGWSSCLHVVMNGYVGKGW